jgi:hydroxymethylpyrimidine/phosphomethylpyrimidine kinase
VVAEWARRSGVPLVVDPVMISKHGAALLAEDAARALAEELIPHCALVTPNTPEAARLTGLTVDDREGMLAAGRQLLRMGAGTALIKGGHLQGDEAADLLVTRGGEIWLAAPRLDTPHTHGTGCVTAAAITAGLAHGLALEAAVRQAKAFVTEAIRQAPGLGRGCGPLHLFAEFTDV